MKTLILDLETSPNIAHVWGLFNQNISLSQLRQSSYMLCWAARWRGEKKVEFKSVNDADHISHIYYLVDQADAVVHYNGTKFDMPVLHREFLMAGLGPPAPYKNIDLYKTVAKKFRFTSGKLAHVASELGIQEKLDTGGHELWVRVMNDDPKAWALMKKYNIQDVKVTEQLLDILEPWIDQMPNHQLYSDIDCCPRCGETDTLIRQGYAYTALGKFQRYRCGSCQGWSRSGKRIAGVTEQVER